MRVLGRLGVCVTLAACQPAPVDLATAPPDASALLAVAAADPPPARSELVWQPAASADKPAAPDAKAAKAPKPAPARAASAPTPASRPVAAEASARPAPAPAPVRAPVPVPVRVPAPVPVPARVPAPVPVPVPAPVPVPVDAGPRDPAKRGGVGVRIERRGTELVVVGVIPNSPCQKAGVQVGDVLVRIDGRPASASDIVGSHIRGVPGLAGTVVVLVWRRGLAERTTRLVRVDWAVLFPGG